MAKKLDYKWQIGFLVAVTIVFVALFLGLFIANFLSTLAFVLILIALLLLFGGLLCYIILMRRREIKRLELQKKIEKQEYERKIKEIYDILGIEIQYNSDGSVKDVFQLLGIEPVFDENGERILTPYELIGINPKFSSLAKEVPSVFVIKNRVKRVAKGIVEAPVFTYKPQKEKKIEPEKKIETINKKKEEKKPAPKKANKTSPSQFFLKPAKGGKIAEVKSGGFKVEKGNKPNFKDLKDFIPKIKIVRKVPVKVEEVKKAVLKQPVANTQPQKQPQKQPPKPPQVHEKLPNGHDINNRPPQVVKPRNPQVAVVFSHVEFRVIDTAVYGKNNEQRGDFLFYGFEKEM